MVPDMLGRRQFLLAQFVCPGFHGLYWKFWTNSSAARSAAMPIKFCSAE